MQNFCYKCGKSKDEDTELIENLCLNCYKDSHSLLNFPNPLQIKLCKKCNRFFSNNKWVSSANSDIENVMDDALKESLPVQISKNPKTRLEITPNLVEKPEYIPSMNSIYVDIKAIGRAHESLKEYTEEYNAQKVNVFFSLCPFCLSFRRGDYQAVLHVIAVDRDLIDWEIDLIYSLVADKVEKMVNIDYLAYISKFTSKKSKITFYVGSEKFARLIASLIKFNLGGNLKETYKTGFRKIPKEVKRNKLYISLYLSAYTAGDLLFFNNSPVCITKIQSKYVTLVNLNTFNTSKVPQKLLENAQILKRKSDLRSYLYLSKTNEMMQFLDLENYQVFEIAISPMYGKLEIGNYLKGFEMNGQILIIPGLYEE